MPNSNVLVDVAGAVVVLVLATGVIAKTSKSLTSYFVLPVILLGVHVYGNTIQELGIGPEWIRNHLHNTGVAGLSMIWSLFYTLLRMRGMRNLDQARLRPIGARIAMNTTMYIWTIASVSGVVQEVLAVTIWGEDSKAMGYSGRLDWFDISAYGVGALLMALNHLRLKPRILAKVTRRQYGTYA